MFYRFGGCRGCSQDMQVKVFSQRSVMLADNGGEVGGLGGGVDCGTFGSVGKPN